MIDRNPFVTARPFLKWAGGKRWLAPDLVRAMPTQIDTYYEPFLGGGAVFWELMRSVAAGERTVAKCALSDINEDLIWCYRSVRDDVESVIECLSVWPDDRDLYYVLRDCPDRTTLLTATSAAARFIYLNQCGFNGLQRVNKAGRNNVPYGKRAKPWRVSAENLRACSRALRDVSLRVGSYTGAHASRRDVVYFDPPYLGTFTDYSAGGFSTDDQVELANRAKLLAGFGATVFVSNSLEARHLYPVALVIDGARRAINSDGTGRGPIKELLWCSGGK